KTVYKNLYRSITAYDPKHVDTLVRVENKIYDRIVQLQKTELATKANNLFGLTRKTKADHVHLHFLRKFDQMKQRSLEKELYSKPDVIKNLEEQRLDNPVKELIRLKSNPRISESLSAVNNKRKLSTLHQIALGRSIELQETLKETHFVINHGQNLDLMIV